MKATDNKTHDSQCKVEALGSSVKEVIADAGVDGHGIFRQLASRGIEPVIKVRRDAVIRGNKVRDEVVR